MEAGEESGGEVRKRSVVAIIITGLDGACDEGFTEPRQAASHFYKRRGFELIERFSVYCFVSTSLGKRKPGGSQKSSQKRNPCSDF